MAMKRSMKKAMKAAKKAMKARSMKKAMKSMKRRAMKVSIVATNKLAKLSVFRGKKVRTSGGLKKNDLIKNKNGKVVSKKASLKAKKAYANGIGKWAKATVAARKQLGIKGFCPIGGKSAKGAALLKKVRSLYRK